MKNVLVGTFLGALLLGSVAFAQQTDATVSGTVTDPTGAHVVAAVVTALNTGTGVAIPATTNEAGIYNMPQLPPGKYNFTAEHPGFRKSVISDVELQVGAQLVMNMGLELGQTSESVEVKAAATEVNATSASVGNVVDGKRLQELPLNGRSAYDLILTQPGVQAGSGWYLNGNQGGAVNFTMDGVTSMDNLHLNATFYLYSNVVSVDRAEEFRVVTSPADAEYGRGAGQVQMVTRAGGNRFNGSVFYEVRNAAFNANNWFGNAQGSDASGNPLSPRSQLKQNNYGIRFGGPVKKNKMFFNGIYEPYKQRNFSQVNRTVYTAQALAGNFRFYPGVTNGNAQAAIPTVDRSGNPVAPIDPVTHLPIALSTVSVLGRDPARLTVDSTGVMAHVLSYMPLPNNYLIGDGLNTAGFTWNQPTPVNFELYEGRIDYNFNEKQHLTLTLGQQSYHSFNVATPPPYPTTPGNSDPTETTSYSVALNSVLRPNLLNEVRVGVFRYRTLVQTPYDPSNPGSKGFLPTIGGVPALVSPANITGPYGNFGIPGNYLNPNYQYGENLTWVRGRHTFKGGVQMRYISLSGFNFGASQTVPIVGIGAPPTSPINNISTGNAIPNIGSNAALATGLLENLTGSTSGAQQLNISPGGANPVFLPGQQPYHNYHQNEFDWFFKDDWKITSSLTLNLGVRWELYLPPSEQQGKGLTPVGGGAGVFGISGTNFGALFNPTATGGTPTVIQPIGPGTPNSSTQFYGTDYNNFSPALGLAWAVPGKEGIGKWISGGPNRMTIRAGYGVGYQRVPLGLIDVNSSAEPGYSETDVEGISTNMTNVVLPIQPAGKPLTPVPVILPAGGQHNQTIYGYQNNLRTPYVQNYNLTITRALSNSITLDVAYVGSKGTKLIRSVDVNEVNIYENGILNAFNTVLAGGDSPLINKIFDASKYSAVAAIGTGSKYVLANSNTNGFFATNNPGGFANFISQTTTLGGSSGALLTNAGLPANFIVANPQFLHAYLTGNYGNSTYNSLQVQLNKRFSRGFSVQSSYVWSHNLGDSEGDSPSSTDNFRTLRNESLDKRPLSFDYQSVFKLNGIYELPFGKGKLLGGNANGLVDRVIGGWQIGAISLMYSGQPITFSAQNTINNTGSNSAAFAAQLLGSVPGDGVSKTGNGIIYFPGLTQIIDPSVANIANATLRAQSTLKAIAGANGSPLLVNPLPGVMGSSPLGALRGPGAKQVNVNVIKRIRITERFNAQIGATAENITNTPIFANPQMSINSTAFGRITSTGGTNPQRLIVLQARFNF